MISAIASGAIPVQRSLRCDFQADGPDRRKCGRCGLVLKTTDPPDRIHAKCRKGPRVRIAGISQEYMSAELPVIASNFRLWKQIIDGVDCGICVDPNSPEKISNTIRFLIDSPDWVRKMGRSGRQAVLEKYNWRNEVKKLITFYETLGMVRADGGKPLRNSNA